MEKVRVSASVSYDVCIGRDILGNVGELALEVIKPCRAAIVTDDTVSDLYGDTVEKSLENSGFETSRFIFPNGEKSKNTDVLIDILSFLSESGITRSDVVIALGGGVCGDMAGFAASCFLRGVKFIQIPTTFLAAIDSSVGGKTGVNLKAGKNLMGAFYQPSLVVCDCDTFKTLPKSVFADGVAEAIKYGVICDKPLFDLIAEGRIEQEILHVVKTCVEIKSKIVHEDERDKGVRQLLNFGHTIGHAIEKASDYTISHGHGVAIGMVAVSRAVNTEIAEEIKRVNTLCNLPSECEFTAERLSEIASSDKKRSGDSITLVIPEEIGKCVLKKISIDSLSDFIAKGISNGR